MNAHLEEESRILSYGEEKTKFPPSWFGRTLLLLVEKRIPLLGRERRSVERLGAAPRFVWGTEAWGDRCAAEPDESKSHYSRSAFARTRTLKHCGGPPAGVTVTNQGCVATEREPATFPDKDVESHEETCQPGGDSLDQRPGRGGSVLKTRMPGFFRSPLL